MIDTSHPMLRSCRLLVLPESAARCFNEMPIGPRASVAASGIDIVRSGGRRAFRFLDTGNNLVSFGAARNYIRPVRGITVVVRCRVTGNNSGSQPTVSGIVNCRSGAMSTTNAGWGFFHVESGFINTGMNWSVFGPGNQITSVRDGSTATFVASDHTYCGTWSATDGSQQLFTDGVVVAGATSTSPTYNLDSTAPIVLGGHSDVDNRLDGQIDLVAVFDRVLSNAEIRAWNNRGRFPFEQVESVTTQTGDTVDFNTVVQAGSVLGVSGLAGVGSYGNSISARGALGGTIEAVDAPASPSPGVIVVASYTTGLGIAGPANAGTPELETYNTLVSAASSAVTSGIARYESEVGVSGRTRTRTDNRNDLIAFSRYRR